MTPGLGTGWAIAKATEERPPTQPHFFTGLWFAALLQPGAVGAAAVRVGRGDRPSPAHLFWATPTGFEQFPGWREG